jgi:uncharacterized protein (TIGR03086 family)
MTEIAERFRRRAAAFTARVEAVKADRWEDQSPCDEWTARDIVDHMVGNMGRFLGFVDRRLPAGPSVAEDPAAAWRSARNAVQEGLDDPSIAGHEFDGGMGKTTYEQAVDRFAGIDLVVHSWDLARATGGDEHLDPDDVHAIFETATPMDEMLRGPGVCTAKLDPPAGADEQTQLLAFMGRRA